MLRQLLPVISVLALAGCPTTSGAPGFEDAAPRDANPGQGDGGPQCQQTCPISFYYPADGVGAVELRGDFVDDGWDVGVPLQLDGDFFVGSIELMDGQQVQYKFVLDGTTWVDDPGNAERYDDGTGTKNSVITARCDCQQARFDWRDGLMYFVFVDRFFDGDASNNDPIGGVENAANYRGGDLVGVRHKLEEGYFGALGVNILWLTAPVDNGDTPGLGFDGHLYTAYHGYWPSDLSKVESRIGTMEELRAVVDAAHARGIKVVLDYVMNHVHSDSPVYAEHPEWFWTLEECGVCGVGCDWNDEIQRKKCWFTPYLPDFNFTNSAARQFSVDNALQWIADTGIDGFRLDAVKHIETEWVTDLRNRLNIEVPGPDRFYLVGETFTGERDLIKFYIDPETRLDGQFDFPLRAELARVILARQGSMIDLANFADVNDEYYGPGSIMGTFIGNHDLPRSIHLAEDTPLWDPWNPGQDRAWVNVPGLPDNKRPFERLALSYVYMMTTRGIPLIYYGDEYGMAGAGDPDNRREMAWGTFTPDQMWLRDRIAKLSEIRAAHPALSRGRRSTIFAAWDTLVYQMAYERDYVLVAINRADADALAEGLPAGSYRELITNTVVTAPLTLPPRSAYILVRE